MQPANVHYINYSAIIQPWLQYECCNHYVSVFGEAKEGENEEEKGGGSWGTCLCCAIFAPGQWSAREPQHRRGNNVPGNLFTLPAGWPEAESIWAKICFETYDFI